MTANDVVPYGTASQATLQRGADNNPDWIAEADAHKYRAPDAMLSDKMPALVKGVGYARPGGNRPLDDDEEVFKRSMRAEHAFRGAIKQGIENPQQVVKGMSPEFAGQFGSFLANSPQNQGMLNLVGQLNQQLSDALGKSITLTSPLNSGFVPFDLN